MATKPVRFRDRASADLDDAAAYYRREAGELRAIDFIDAVERAVQQIAESSLIGGLHFAYELSIPDLRVWPVADFPYLVFYRDAGEVVDVWRLLHTSRDIPIAVEE